MLKFTDEIETFLGRKLTISDPAVERKRKVYKDGEQDRINDRIRMGYTGGHAKIPVSSVFPFNCAEFIHLKKKQNKKYGLK